MFNDSEQRQIEMINSKINLMRKKNPEKPSGRVVWKKQERDAKGRWLTYEGADPVKYSQSQVDALIKKAVAEAITTTASMLGIPQSAGMSNQQLVEVASAAFIAGLNDKGSRFFAPSRKLEMYLSKTFSYGGD